VADLTTLALVKAYANITGTDSGRDAVLEDLIDGATAAMELYMGRVIGSTAYTSEKLDGTGNDVLMLRQWPVTTFTSLYEGTTVVDSAYYEVDLAAGLVYAISGSGWVSDGIGGAWTPGRRNYSANYTAGYAAIPEDIANACVRQVTLEWKRSGIKGDRIGVSSTQLGDGSTAGYRDGQWAEGVEDVMRAYRRLR
jgi:hypothetical protein